MPAPFKRTRTESIKSIAENVITTLKQALDKQSGNVHEIKLNVQLYGHGARPFGAYLPTDYRDISIMVDNKHWDGLDNHDVFSLKLELEKHLSEFDNVAKDGIFLSYGNFTPDIEDFPTTFRTFGKPCKEWKQLVKLVEKKYNKQLKIDDIYEVALFGKNGRYGESGDRGYVAFDSEQCIEYINEIKSFGRKKTTMTIENDDNIDTEYSAIYLTECYGVRNRKLIITMNK